ncbi:MAG: 3-beta hydroxysteroid dehydrogenase [Opitutae bacterium]|nr:3-beta hydroxysteroid dehydrogenase [Opitutae bacterium]
MKLLITGIAGYIGSNLAVLAKERGFTVTGIDSFTPYYSPKLKRHTAKELQDLGVEIQDADLTETDLSGIIRGVNAVVHLAAQPGISSKVKWKDYYRNNIVATHRLLEESKKSRNLETFVNISTSSCYGYFATKPEEMAAQPASWYGVTKLAAEQEVLALNRSSGFPACSLRLFSVYGERERPDKLFPKLLRSIYKNEEFPLFEGSLEHQRSFTYVKDICEGIILSIEKYRLTDGEIFNLGTDQSFTTAQAIETVENLLGKKISIKKLPKRNGDQNTTIANISKIKHKLGWKPRTSLEDGLSQTISWYRRLERENLDWI